MRITLVFAVAGLATGCALSPTMPPLTHGYLPAGGAHPAAPNHARRPPRPTPVPDRHPFAVEYDSAQDLSRVSVRTHRGSYFLWIQKPQLTFFYVHSGRFPAEPPPVVYLIFRTQSPQSVRGNALHLTCDGSTSAVPGLPDSRVEPGVLASSHYLTFKIATEAFIRFSRCRAAALDVGGVRATFNPERLDQLRTLAAGLPAAPS